MKKLFLATTAFSLLGGSAAPPICRGRSLKARAVGSARRGSAVQVGSIWHSGRRRELTTNRVPDLDGSGSPISTPHVGQKDYGGTVGGQVGYNWQTNCTAVGSRSIRQLDQRQSRRLPTDAQRATSSVESRIAGSGLAGCAPASCSTTFCFTLTGGVAAAHTKTHWFHDDPPEFNPGFSVKDGAGAGSRVSALNGLGPTGSLKSEVLYVDLVDKEYRTTSFFTGSTDATSFKHRFVLGQPRRPQRDARRSAGRREVLSFRQRCKSTEPPAAMPGALSHGCSCVGMAPHASALLAAWRHPLFTCDACILDVSTHNLCILQVAE